MHFSPLALTAFAAVAVAHPLEPRANALPPVVSDADTNTLQLALYLEHLEESLYSGGYSNFTDEQYTAEGFPAGFRENVGVIAQVSLFSSFSPTWYHICIWRFPGGHFPSTGRLTSGSQHETTHADTISNILTAAGKTPVPRCSYKFPYDSPTTFVDLANQITSNGIGAYLGGAAFLRDNAPLLTAASAILTVEARHDAYLRAGVKGSPFPTSFDTSVTSVFAYNIAQNFIVKCPQQLPLPILPKLTLTSPPPSPNIAPVPSNTKLAFKFDPSTFFVKVDESKPLYIGLINSVTNVTYTELTKTGNGEGTIPVPEGAAGAAFAVLTTFGPDAALSEDQLTEFGALAGPAEIILS